MKQLHRCACFRPRAAREPGRSQFAGRIALVLFALGVMLVPAGTAAQTTPPQTVYATTQPSSGPVNLNAFQKDSATGTLSGVSGSPFDERLDGAATAVDALGRFLFVVNPSNNDISMFEIDSTTGALTEVPSSPFASGPYSFPSQAPTTPLTLTTEPTGQYLYVGYQNASNGTGGAIASFFIDAQHLMLVPTTQMSIYLTSESPVALLTDPRGRNLYAGYGPPPYSGNPPSGIEVYQIDPTTGGLSEAANVTTGETGRTMAIDPMGRFIFLGHGAAVGFIDGWQLSPVDSLPGAAVSGVTLNTGEFPLAMAVDSSGAYLYAETTSGLLHIYAIDQTSGDLTEVPDSPQAFPLSSYLTADPQGPYLYAVNSAGVHAYQINLQTGLPSELAGSPYPVSAGSTPRGIAISGSNPSVAPTSGPYPQFDAQQETFPDTVVTTSSSVSDRMVNNGTQALLIDSFSITGSDTGDFSQTNDCPVSLSSGDYCTFHIIFSPAAAGLRQAALVIADNGPGGQQSITLEGTGLAAQPAVTLVPGNLTYATILAGTTSAPQSVTLTNSGYATLHVSGVALSGANPGDFSFTNGCTSAVTASGKCSIQVSFTPTAAGQRTAQLLISDDAPDSPQSISLSGGATDPYTLSAASGGATDASVQPGQTAQYSLEVNPASGFSGTVALQCSGAPAEATCLVSPSTLSVSGSSTPFGVSVTTTTGARLIPLGAPPTPPPARPWLPAAVALAALFLLQAAKRRAQDPRVARPAAVRARRTGIALIAALAAAMAIAGCSGGGGGSSSTSTSGGNPGGTPTPPGTSTLTVTAVSGKVREQIQLTLTVQ